MQALERQSDAWVHRYSQQLRGAAEGAFPRGMAFYMAQLKAQGPNIVTRPIHQYSDDVTTNIYALKLLGRRRAQITNPRLRSLGRRRKSGARAPDARRRPRASDNEDVSGYINLGYNRTGKRRARAFRLRKIRDSYHLHAWRVAYPKIRQHYRSHVLRSIAHG